MQRLDEFMADALASYYDTRDPFGSDGDFITAPEISQLFGEIIGIWAVQQWVRIGSPSSFHLIEIGGGRGTLMADLLRATKHIPNFHESMSVCMIETSTTLKQKQNETLSNYTNITWHEHIHEISNELPVIIIGNEFFDALPIRQFKYKGNQWAECFIGGDKIVWKDVDTHGVPVKPTLPPPQNGDVMEYSEAQQTYAELLSKYKGAKLFIDYGYEISAYGDSLQALYKHKPCAITNYIGEADVTSHIDFEWLSTFFKNTSIKTQREFLKENGIDIRFQQIGSPDLEAGYNCLITYDQMGKLFKVLEVYD